MGSFPSHHLDDDDIRDLKGSSGMSQYQIQCLYLRFTYLDRRNCAALSPLDLMRIPEMALNPLRHRIIAAVFAECQDPSVAGTFGGQGGDINFRQFLHVCSIFIVPKYHESLDEEQRLACRKRKLNFLRRVIDTSGLGWIKRSDLLETITLIEQAQPAGAGQQKLLGDLLRRTNLDSAADVLAASERSDELNEKLTEVFGTKDMISYEAFDVLMEDIDVDVMSIEMWHDALPSEAGAAGVSAKKS